jgi:N-acetylmuramoyl-L-alanine amidase
VGWDALIRRLDQRLATAEQSDPAAHSLQIAAANLYFERYKRFRSPADFVQAETRLNRIASLDTSSGCDALARLATLRQLAEDRSGAQSAWVAYTRRCPDGPAMAHIRASLALSDPQMAHAVAATPSAHAAGATGGLSANSGRLRRIVVDAGHGGSDPGARGPAGLRESEVTLSVARRLADRLSSEYGVEVVLTRDRDVYVTLEDRARRANEARAELFVSVHCNASERAEARGVSVYAIEQSERVQARFARRINNDREIAAVYDDDVSRIVANLQLSAQGARSFALAQQVQASLLHDLRARYENVDDMGVHSARFSVLVGTEMPAVLVELSFISNPLEEARLADDRYQTLLANAIARAIVGENSR